MSEKSALELAMEKNNVSIKSEFVPLSKSRNANTKDERGNPVLSLNWNVTLQRNGRDILTTEYSAGMGHCPSFNREPPASWDRPKRMWQSAVCEWECENGFQAVMKPYLRDFTKRQAPRSQSDIEAGKPRVFFPIMPGAANVLYSILMDASVLDSGGFEEWANELGYDPDSRHAESIYRACLEIALKVRSGLGESVMSELQTAAQDF